MKVEKELNMEKFGEKGKGKMRMEIENFNYNLPVEIEAPQESKSLDEVLVPFFKEYVEKLKTLEEKTKDTQIIFRAVQLKAIAEMMKKYENSFSNLCKNGNLNEEKKELGEIKEEIKKLQGGILNISCYSSKESFCFCVDLVSSNKGKYCLDSSGIAKEIDQNSDCLGEGTKENPYRCP
jgi:glutamine synthetase type III